MPRTEKTALITGASSGLGAEFAKLFARDGHDVVLVARRRDKLEEVASGLDKTQGVKATLIAADLADREARRRLFDQIAGMEVEFLVNNAGYGTNGPFWQLDVERELGMIEVNVTALVHLTRLFLPAMVERKRGRVLNLGSTAAFVPGPFMANYYATKAYVVSFTEALAHELKGTGVTATVSCPGATATEFSAIAGNDKSALFKGGAAGATEVALHAYRAMHAGKVLAIPGAKNKLTVQAIRFSPRAAGRGIAARLNRPG